MNAIDSYLYGQNYQAHTRQRPKYVKRGRGAVYRKRERVLIRAMVVAGFSTRDIAQHVKRTRAAILGFCHYYGIRIREIRRKKRA